MHGTEKHGGGSVTIWGYMAVSGVGKLVLINGVNDKYQYFNILKNSLKIIASDLGLSQ